MNITNEREAIEALTAVVKWAHSGAETVAIGGATGVTAQRGRVVATKVMPDNTIGVSTYNTVEDARGQTIDIDRGYRAWSKLKDFEP